MRRSPHINFRSKHKFWQKIEKHRNFAIDRRYCFAGSIDNGSENAICSVEENRTDGSASDVYKGDELYCCDCVTCFWSKRNQGSKRKVWNRNLQKSSYHSDYY